MDMPTTPLPDNAVDALSFNIAPFFVMLLMGLLGGLLSWVSTHSGSKFNIYELVKHLLTGLMATFMVPVFLQMIGSSLLKDISPAYQQFYVFLGMCSAVAFVSQNFANSISQRLLQDANSKAEHAEITAQEASAKTASIEVQQLKLQGAVHFLKDEFEQALMYFDEYLTHNPKDANTLWRKAYCLKRREKFSEAIDCINKAIEFSEKKVPALLYFNRACYKCLALMPIESVISDLNEAVKLDEVTTKKAVKSDLDIDFAGIREKQEFIDFLTQIDLT